MRNPFIDNDIIDFLTYLPEKYRIRKNLYISTICGMFPDIFTEMAYKSNLLSWDDQLKDSLKLKAFLETEFADETGRIFDIISAEKFRVFREETHVTRPGLVARDQGNFIRKYPEIYKIAKYIQTWFRRRTGRTKMTVRRGVIVRRVLTLKIWCDLFLSGRVDGDIAG
jgi:hypothetical protein